MTNPTEGSSPKLFQDVRDRLRAATPGKWRFSPASDAGDWELIARVGDDMIWVKQDDSDVPISKEDGELIANCPTDIAKLLSALDEAVHTLERIAEYRGEEAYSCSGYDAGQALERIQKMGEGG